MTKLEFRSFRGPGEQSRGRRGAYGQETRTDGYTKHQIREAGALDVKNRARYNNGHSNLQQFIDIWLQ